MMVIDILTKKTSEKQRDQAENRGGGGHRHRPQPTHPVASRIASQGKLALFDLLVDLLDQHDGILDQQPDQTQCTQQRHKIERAVEGQQTGGDANDRQRHREPDDQRLTQSAKQPGCWSESSTESPPGSTDNSPFWAFFESSYSPPQERL